MKRRNQVPQNIRRTTTPNRVWRRMKELEWTEKFNTGCIVSRDARKRNIDERLLNQVWEWDFHLIKTSLHTMHETHNATTTQLLFPSLTIECLFQEYVQSDNASSLVWSNNQSVNAWCHCFSRIHEVAFAWRTLITVFPSSLIARVNHSRIQQRTSWWYCKVFVIIIQIRKRDRQLYKSVWAKTQESLDFWSSIQPVKKFARTHN